MEMDPGEGERDNRREKIQWEQRKMQYKGEKDGNYHTGRKYGEKCSWGFC